MRKTRQGRLNNLGLAGLNNFGGLRAIEVVSSCLLPGPGMIKAEEYCLLGPERGGMAPDWIVKDAPRWVLCISKNWLASGRALSPQPKKVS